jgi:multidrug efflux system outer membrane protein
LPIFNTGRTQAGVDSAEARAEQALAQYQQTIQQAFREVADALAGRRWLAEQVTAQTRATEAQRRIAALAETRYREGVANYLEVLDAERNLFTAEQALVQLRRSELDNLVSLYVALGGGAIESSSEAQAQPR